MKIQGSKLVKDLQVKEDFEPVSVQSAKAFNEVFIQPVQKQLDELNNGILRQNKHADRDPNVTLKFKDGGHSFLQEIEIEQEEEKQQESIDIILFLMKQFNKSKQTLQLKTKSPFSG